MNGYISVKNWEEFQHYKDRTPPWIKLHRDLLNNYEFSCLQTASKAHLMLIWLLASQMDNKVPNDPKWISARIGETNTVDLKPLIDNGFLIVEQSDSNALAKRSLETETETEAEEETEEDKEGKPSMSAGTPTPDETPNCPHMEIIDIYHETLPMLPRVIKKLWHESESAKNLKARWRALPEHQNLDFWREYFAVVKTNPHWLGDNNREWTANLHWLVNRTNFNKVMTRWVGQAA